MIGMHGIRPERAGGRGLPAGPPSPPSPPMPATYEIRDPIHRTITIDEQERVILDHPWVQRLRHIRQLGLVSMVYPGAVHDRFQHSLGVMHLAGEFFQRLRQARPKVLAAYDEKDLDYAWRVVRLAGLLHDVGHAPFSHSTEDCFPAVETVSLPTDWYRAGMNPRVRRASHEDAGLAIVHALVEQKVIADGLGRDVAAVLCLEVRRSPRLRSFGGLVRLLRALVSGEMDADRCDYLLRDSHFTGVSYGVYDLQRLMACLVALDGPEGPELGLDVHGVFALEGLLMARYHMFHQVYFHKTPPSLEYFFERAIEEGEVDLSLERGITDLVALRDDSLLAQAHGARAAGRPWSRRLLNREPGKLVLRERMGAEQQENFLAQELVGALRGEGCHVFVRRSRQRFSDLAGAAGAEAGTRLLCERRILGRPIVEPVTAHSALLSAFNSPIDVRHTYVLREDEAKARTVMERLKLW